MPQWYISKLPMKGLAYLLFALSVAAAAPAAPLEKIALVRLSDLDRTVAYELMPQGEMRALLSALAKERRVFLRARRNAAQQWEAKPENGRFPGLRVAPRALTPIASFRDDSRAEARLARYRNRKDRLAGSRSPHDEVRTKAAVAVLENQIRYMLGEPVEDVPADEPVPQPLHAGELLVLHNQVRERYGRTRLELHDQLGAAAQKFADFMATTGRYGHNVNGTLTDRLKAEGYRGQSYGENIAMGHPSSRDVVNGWLGSPGHKKNIFHRPWRYAGFGMARSAAGLYWVAVFGRD